MSSVSEKSAMVLAGGLGTRLRPVVADMPKVLVPVAGRPFLGYLLDQLRDAGFGRVMLCTGHLGEQVQAELGSSYRGIELTYSRETTPLGTAGAIRLALPLVQSETVLVMNGDSFCGVDLGSVWKWHAARAADTTVVLVEVRDTARYGTVSSSVDGRITAFVEKGTRCVAGWINAGIYVIARDRLETIPSDHPVSLEQEMMPLWIEHGVNGYRTGPGTRFLDIGVPEAYAEAERFFSKKVGNG
jgi:NDP-sugar pyrophosphorylase family protein